MPVEKPYQDPDRLRELYVDERLSYAEIARRFDCSDETVRLYADRFGIERGEEWKDADRLRELYVDERLSVRQIADRFPVSRETIRRWLDRHSIDRRSVHEYNLPGVLLDPDGYEYVKVEHDGDQFTTSLHRLLAVAEFGFDAVVGKDIHHKNGIPWDNRPSNIEPIEHAEHVAKHNRSATNY